jgi:hypothetical protein
LFSPNSFSARANDPPELDTTNRPTSPTPTAGLGVNGFGPLDTLAGLGFPMDRESQPHHHNASANNANRDRLRGAWDNLRDRLGLHPGRADGDPLPGYQSDDREDRFAPRPNGAGDTMISEMARALGTGLGLQEEGASRRNSTVPPPDPAPSADTSAVGATPANAPAPAEGTFERFLFNLQADLRTVLSDDNTSTTTPPTSDPESAEAPSTSNDQPEIPAAVNSPTEREVVTEVPADVDVTTPIPAPDPSAQPSSPLHHDRRAGGGINLWRSYRFPPIVAPPRPSPLFQPNIPVAATAPYSPIVPESTTPLQPAETATPVPPIFPALDIVVPVIIVGLQSVSVENRAMADQHEDPEGIFPRPESTAGLTPAEAADFEGIPMEDRPNTPRGRPWHSRAASAFRNLRPGRRPGMNATGTNDRNASRTFLIYVIGGAFVLCLSFGQR